MIFFLGNCKRFYKKLQTCKKMSSSKSKIPRRVSKQVKDQHDDFVKYWKNHLKHDYLANDYDYDNRDLDEFTQIIVGWADKLYVAE